MFKNYIMAQIMNKNDIYETILYIKTNQMYLLD
jgi:hypothetical protein